MKWNSNMHVYKNAEPHGYCAGTDPVYGESTIFWNPFAESYFLLDHDTEEFHKLSTGAALIWCEKYAYFSDVHGH